MLWNSGSVLFDNHPILGKVMTMRRYILIGLYTLCMGLMASEGFAQVARRLNARAEALAGAGIGLIGSGQAIQYNPAGLAFMDGWEAYFTFIDINTTLDINTEYSQRAYKTGIAGNTGIGTFGLSATSSRVRYNDVNEDYSISGGYGYKINNRLAVGATLHLFHAEWRETNNLDLDLGAYFVTGLRNTVVAAGVENLKTGIGNSDLVRLRAGLFLDMMALLDSGDLPHYLDLVVDVNDYIDVDGDLRANLGIEYQYRYLLSGYALEIALRGGVPSVYGSGSAKTTWGIGLKFETEGDRGIKVDYAPFGSAVYSRHIVSMAFIF